MIVNFPPLKCPRVLRTGREGSHPDSAEREGLVARYLFDEAEGERGPE